MKDHTLASSRRVGMRDINALFPSPLVGEGARRAGEGYRFGFTLKCHAESSLLSISTAKKTQGRDPEQKPFGMALCKGFTLIELLIVVLIIGVLAAIAVPQYQQAVLKSRFNGLMPITRAVVNAQEVYYMEHGNYSTDITQLDIKAPSNGASANITVPGADDSVRFDYVMTTRPDARGVALVMYQKRSEQFPGAVMCEANDTLNSKATWLCQTALHGTLVESGSLQGSDWKAYLLSGVEGDSSFSSCSGRKPDDIETSQSHAKGIAYCDEDSGEWKYEWTKQGDKFDQSSCDGSTEYACANSVMVGTASCRGDAEYACADSTFEEAATCKGESENACANSTFTGASSCQVGCSGVPNGCANTTFTDGAHCFTEKENGCANSAFTNNAYCEGKGGNGCANSTFAGGAHCSGKCANSTFTDGAYCSGECANSTFTDGAHCSGGCVGAIIQDNSYCNGQGCESAIYSGTGCCMSCVRGSNVPKCQFRLNQVGSVSYGGGWDGESYW